jgi:microcystin synthetase protein McyA
LFPDVDLSQTVGWFTSIFPVYLAVDQPFDAEFTLKSLKEQLRAIPNRGITHGLLRYLNSGEIAGRLAQLPRPEIAFNYLGQFSDDEEGSEWQALNEPTGLSFSSRQSRPYLWELNAAVYGDRFELDWAYSENFHKRSTVDGLAQQYIEDLRCLIDHCLSRNVRTFTPSDFSKAKLTQRDLDTLLSTLAARPE